MRQKRGRRLLYIGAAAVVLAAFSIFGAALLLPTQPYSMPTLEESSTVDSELPARFPRIPELPEDASFPGEESPSESSPSLPDSGEEEPNSPPAEPEPDEPKPATPSSREEPPPVEEPEPTPLPKPQPEPTPETEAEEITLANAAVTLAVGESSEIRMASAPARVLNYGATWQVDNKLVADFVTADRRGVTIEGKHKGKTKVTVTSKDGTLSASCLVTVI